MKFINVFSNEQQKLHFSKLDFSWFVSKSGPISKGQAIYETKKILHLGGLG
jgi:hypothetical protein